MSPPPARAARPPDSLVLRPLRWEDFEPLIAIYYELYDERADGQSIGVPLFRERPSRADEVDWFAGLYRRMLKEEVVVVIAEVEGRTVGNCTVGPVGPLRESDVGHLGVLGILLDRRFRGQGIGTALLVRTLEECRGKFEQVRLSVFTDNEGAIRIYRRVGFVPCGRIPRAVKRGGLYTDEELMILDLAHWAPPDGPRNH